MSRASREARRMKSFSKVIVACVMGTYFVGVAVGCIVVLRSGSELSTLLTFIGALVGVAFGGYFVKAGFENVKKIGKNGKDNNNDLGGV